MPQKFYNINLQVLTVKFLSSGVPRQSLTFCTQLIFHAWECSIISLLSTYLLLQQVSFASPPSGFDCPKAKRGMMSADTSKREVFCILAAAVGLTTAVISRRRAKAADSRHRQEIETQKLLLRKLQADYSKALASQSGAERNARDAQVTLKEVESKLSILQNDLKNSERELEAVSERLQEEHRIALQNSKVELEKVIEEHEAQIKTILTERDEALTELEVVHGLSLPVSGSSQLKLTCCLLLLSDKKPKWCVMCVTPAHSKPY